MLAADAVSEEIDCGHGQVEYRTCSVIADLRMVEKASEWASLQGWFVSRRRGKTERETALHHQPHARRPDAARLNHSIRQHWCMENKLHWVLDVGFGRSGPQTHRPRRSELLRAQPHRLNLLKQKRTCELSIRANASKQVGTTNIFSICWEIKMRFALPSNKH